jgi:hypothetical protein
LALWAKREKINYVLKNKTEVLAQWLVPIIQATEEAEIRRITIQG